VNSFFTTQTEKSNLEQKDFIYLTGTEEKLIRVTILVLCTIIFSNETLQKTKA
jgi:hypothetical protein